jgi:hypothetical protein
MASTRTCRNSIFIFATQSNSLSFSATRSDPTDPLIFFDSRTSICFRDEKADFSNWSVSAWRSFRRILSFTAVLFIRVLN